MRWSAVAALAGLMIGGCSGAAANSKPDEAQKAEVTKIEHGHLQYPVARKGDVVTDYHGTRVADPYRWLEDSDSEETRAWIDAENEVTFGYLDQIASRKAIRERLTELWDYEKYGVPFKEGGRYFYTFNPGLLNQNQLFTMTALDAEPTLLLDPNTLSEDGTIALTGYAVSPDGKRLAYALSESGSDWKTWRVRDIETGRDLDDEVKWSKFSGASWDAKGAGFYYSAYDPPEEGEEFTGTNFFQKLFYHRVGTKQDADVLVYERKDHKEWGFDGTVTDDGRYLIIHVWKGTDNENEVYYVDLHSKKREVVELLVGFDASYDYIGNDGTLWWFKTTHEAPRTRVISIDIEKPARANWKELIPQAADPLQSATIVGGHLVAEYLSDAKSAVKVFKTDGTEVGRVELPALGSVGGFGGKLDDPETFYAFTGFTHPTTIYRYDVSTGESTVFKQPKVDFDPAAYETKQVFFESKDGTRVPMFLTYAKGLKRDGKNPTYLYGYGGFNISMTPWFSVSNLVWMQMGGVFALPNLRGGGEYGEEWHDAGIKERKQNVFDDFFAAAEWLIANDYTSPEKLAIGGGSNGGLLVGASITQRPELFKAALPSVGVLDMLRYHTWTIGWAWADDYGTSDDADAFEYLHAYSPLHNLRPDTHYPATMITTADHDDRVVPAHSFKFAAALQAAHAGGNPVLIRIETKAGHGVGKPTEKIIEEIGDKWGFLSHVLGGMKVPR